MEVFATETSASPPARNYNLLRRTLVPLARTSFLPPVHRSKEAVRFGLARRRNRFRSKVSTISVIPRPLEDRSNSWRRSPAWVQPWLLMDNSRVRISARIQLALTPYIYRLELLRVRGRSLSPAH